MKKYIEMILRKIGVSMLALLIVMTTYFSNSGGSLFLKTKKVQADTGETTLAMSQAMSSNKIPAIGRAASDGLWAMTAGGHRVWIPTNTATDQKSKHKCNKNDGKSGQC